MLGFMVNLAPTTSIQNFFPTVRITIPKALFLAKEVVPSQSRASSKLVSVYVLLLPKPLKLFLDDYT